MIYFFIFLGLVLVAVISIHSFTEQIFLKDLLCDIWYAGDTEMDTGFCFSAGSLYSNVGDTQPSMKRNNVISDSDLSAMRKKHG